VACPLHAAAPEMLEALKAILRAEEESPGAGWGSTLGTCLARALGGKIVTNDYNLNKVAELSGVPVLNVNELANALRPVALPGEEMRVYVVQEGKEVGQGVGFLDDGTMVVVEGGKRHINTHLSVAVTRVLQTPAGRIIFAQPKSG